MEGILYLIGRISYVTGWPGDWTKPIIVRVYKGKGDMSVSGNYQAITLLNRLAKANRI